MISGDAQQSGGGFGRLITLMGLIAALALLFGCTSARASTGNPAHAITILAPRQTATPEWWADADTDVAGIQPCRKFRNTDSDSFKVNVVVYNVRDLIGFRFLYHFDNTSVEPENVEAVGHLLTSAGGTLQFFQWDKNDAGTAVVVEAHLQQPATPVSGSGTLARLTFKVKAPQNGTNRDGAPWGQTGIDIDGAQLFNPNGGEIPSERMSAKAQVIIDSTTTSGCWMVNTTIDMPEPDSSVGDGICDHDPTAGIVRCSLRAAVQEANAIRDPNRIGFSRIVDGGCSPGQPCRIPLGSTLRLTDAGTTIDGTIVDEGGRPEPVIIVKPAGADPGSVAFYIASANNKICGLKFEGFSDAITISGDEATGDGIFVYSRDC